MEFCKSIVPRSSPHQDKTTKKNKTMNREIKFRVWRTDTNKMCSILHGVTVDEEDLPSDMMPIESAFEWYDDIYILMQFTGGKDKDGREIYEGDIVKQYQAPLTIPDVIGVITYQNFGFSVEGKNPIISHSCKVIGNIYENPELIISEELPDNRNNELQ